MNIKVSIYDNINKKLYDVSQLVSDMTITTHIEQNCGQCTFTIITMPPLAFWEGATVIVEKDDYRMFRGYVMRKERSGSNARLINVTAYDSMKYLEYKDAYMFEADVKASDRFKTICESHGIECEVKDESTAEIEAYANMNGTLMDGIQDAITKEFDATQNRYFVWDDGYKVIWANALSYESPYVLGDGSFITDYSYATYIDKDTYNCVTVLVNLDTSESNSNGDGETTYHVTVGSKEKMQRWGVLSEVIEVGSSETPAEDALKYAKDYIAGCCYTHRELQLSCLGIKEFHAGTTFRCKIADLGDLVVDKLLLVEDCEHSFSGDVHTMTLTCKLFTEIDANEVIEEMSSGSFLTEKAEE